MSTPLPFHLWKDQQVRLDSTTNKVFRYYREYSWYYEAYSRYCNKFKIIGKDINELSY